MFHAIYKTKTLRQSLTTISGTTINGFLGLLFYILLARFLGPTDFGLITISIAMLTLIADVADLGTNSGLIRFVSTNLKHEKLKALKFIKLGLETKLIVWVLVMLVGFFIAPFIAINILKKPELFIPLRLVTIGVGGALLFSFATSTLQAFQKFFSWSAVNILTNFLRLIIILLLFYLSSATLISSLVVYISLPFLGFFLTLLLLPTREFLRVSDEFKLSRQFFSFNKWVAIFIIISAISSRLDTFISAKLLQAKEVGIYSAASQLTMIIPQIVGALGTVAAPKFASFDNKESMILFLKKFQLLTIIFALIGLIAIPISFYLIPLIYGDKYLSSIPVFIILYISMLIFLLAVPIHNSILYYFSRPQFFVWVSIGHLAIMSILGSILIWNFSIIGASLAVLIGMIFEFVVPALYFFYKITEKK